MFLRLDGLDGLNGMGGCGCNKGMSGLGACGCSKRGMSGLGAPPRGGHPHPGGGHPGGHRGRGFVRGGTSFLPAPYDAGRGVAELEVLILDPRTSSQSLAQRLMALRREIEASGDQSLLARLERVERMAGVGSTAPKLAGLGRGFGGLGEWPGEGVIPPEQRLAAAIQRALCNPRSLCCKPRVHCHVQRDPFEEARRAQIRYAQAQDLLTDPTGGLPAGGGPPPSYYPPPIPRYPPPPVPPPGGQPPPGGGDRPRGFWVDPRPKDQVFADPFGTRGQNIRVLPPSGGGGGGGGGGVPLPGGMVSTGGAGVPVVSTGGSGAPVTVRRGPVTGGDSAPIQWVMPQVQIKPVVGLVSSPVPYAHQYQQPTAAGGRGLIFGAGAPGGGTAVAMHGLGGLGQARTPIDRAMQAILAARAAVRRQSWVR